MSAFNWVLATYVAMLFVVFLFIKYSAGPAYPGEDEYADLPQTPPTRAPTSGETNDYHDAA